MSELFDKAIATLAERVTESTHTFGFTNDNLYLYYILLLRKCRDIDGPLKPNYNLTVFNAAHREWNIHYPRPSMAPAAPVMSFDPAAPIACFSPPVDPERAGVPVNPAYLHITSPPTDWKNIFIKEEEFAMTETNVLNTLNQVAPYQCNKMIFGVDIETMDTAACIRTVLRCEKEIEDIKGLPFKTKETNAYQKSLTVAMNECRKKVEIK